MRLFLQSDLTLVAKKAKVELDVLQQLQIKVSKILKRIELYREELAFYKMNELVYRLITDFNYLEICAAMPGGNQRKANIEMFIEKAVEFETTSYHGLFQFIRYIEKLEKYEIDYGEANVSNENLNTVTLMTIHKSKGLEFPVEIGRAHV